MIKICKSFSCIDCCFKSPLFELMSDKELQIIENSRLEVEYYPDEIIFKQGTRTTQLVSIFHGLAKAYIEGFNNKNFIIELVKPTALIVGPGIYVDQKHHFSLKAVVKTSCCFFDLQLFREILSKNPKLSEFMLQAVSHRMAYYYKKFISLSQKQANGRIAEIILYLSNDIYETNPIELSISIQDIAEMTVMNKDTVVRVLKDFCSDNLIEYNGKTINILDPVKLTRISQLG